MITAQHDSNKRGIIMAVSAGNDVFMIFWPFLIVGCLICGGNTCDLNNKIGNGSMPLEFTGPEFGKLHVISKGYQSIPCKARNFCQITWYKDNKSYPWNLGKFNIISLEDRNQTLRFQAAEEDAGGSYTCVASNGSHSIRRTTLLQVDNPFWVANPLQLQTEDNKCRDQTSGLGTNVNFSCYFYVGAEVTTTDVFWLRPNTSSTENKTQWLTLGQVNDSYTYYKQKYIYHDKRHTRNFSGRPLVGSELQVFNVTDVAYGAYYVIANNEGSYTELILKLSPSKEEVSQSNPVYLHGVFVAITGIVVTASLLCFIWKIIVLDLKLWYNGRYGTSEQNDGCLYDAYILYNWTDIDRPFVLNVIMPYLHKYGYNIYVPEIHTIPSNDQMDELSHAMNSSRRCIMVISPSVTTATDEFQFEVEHIMDAMSSSLSFRVIPVYFGITVCADKEPLDSMSVPRSISMLPLSASSTPSSSFPVPSLSSSVSFSSSSSSSRQEISRSASYASRIYSIVSSSSSSSSDEMNSSWLPKSPSPLNSQKLVQVDLNCCPLLGQLVGVLRPIKTTVNKQCKPEHYRHFLKRLRLRMPKPPCGGVPHEMVDVPHFRTIVDCEMTP